MYIYKRRDTWQTRPLFWFLSSDSPQVPCFDGVTHSVAYNVSRGLAYA